MKNYIELETNKIYGIPLANGVLRIDVCQDEDYPGIDIEFIPKHEVFTTRPRVLIEAPIDKETQKQENVRVLVWGKAYSEDYSDEVVFENEQLNKTDGMEMETLSFTDEIGYTEFKVSRNWLMTQDRSDISKVYTLASENPEMSFFTS